MGELQAALVADSASIIADAPSQFTVVTEGKASKFGPPTTTTSGPYWGRIEMGELSEQEGSNAQGSTMTLDFVLLASPSYEGDPPLDPVPAGVLKVGSIVHADGKRYRVKIPYEDRSGVILAQIEWLVQ